MQDEGLAAFLFPQAIVDPDLLPPLQPFGLALGQARAHREIGLGKVQGVFVVRRVGAHFEWSVLSCHQVWERGGAVSHTPCPGGSGLRAPGM